MGRKAVAAKEAEPIDGCSGILGMVMVGARIRGLAVNLSSGSVAVLGEVVFEGVLAERNAISGRGSIASFLIWCLGGLAVACE